MLWYRYRERGESYPLVLAGARGGARYACGCVRSDPSELTVVLTSFAGVLATLAVVFVPIPRNSRFVFVSFADLSEHKREYLIESGDVSFAHIVSSPTKNRDPEHRESTPVNPEESG